MYARPANSGPGRTLLMGLPYLLGDNNPKDPVNGWVKTWSFLKELNNYVEYYPSGTTATMKEFGEGSRDLIASTTGWDINPRVLGIVPKSPEISVFKGLHGCPLHGSSEGDRAGEAGGSCGFDGIFAATGATGRDL